MYIFIFRFLNKFVLTFTFLDKDCSEEAKSINYGHQLSFILKSEKTEVGNGRLNPPNIFLSPFCFFT